tara:strand:- start:701 stop:1564 length:864 start_codon:yes stop_codon:yes gene_type:complete
MSLLSKLKKFPRLYFLLRGLKRVFREALKPNHAPRFIGWYGMTLYTEPPWKETSNKIDSLEHNFLLVDKRLKKSVKDKSFRLIQFEKYNKDIQDILSELTWRHFIVFWSSQYAALNTKSLTKGLVEVGVADGLTLHYAINALVSINNSYKAYLYDTWGSVELINPGTKGASNQYEYLEIETTKENLKEFLENLVFKKGLVPETFSGKNEPESISWLHIDLNSSPPTLDTLNYYWSRLEPGGIVLFDDYAQPAYIDTKIVVDDWLKNRKDGVILQMPTSQAIIFKTKQ